MADWRYAHSADPSFPIVESPFLCDVSLRWPRHRRKRIDKKWRKRFGKVECPGVYCFFDARVLACPHAMEAFRAETPQSLSSAFWPSKPHPVKDKS